MDKTRLHRRYDAIRARICTWEQRHPDRPVPGYLARRYHALRAAVESGRPPAPWWRRLWHALRGAA